MTETRKYYANFFDFSFLDFSQNQHCKNVNYNKKTSKKKIKKLPSILLGIFALIIVIVSFIISANKMMEYVAIKEKNEVLEDVYNNKLLEIDELKYYINTEIDDEYRERMARLMGYCFPDETIYYVE